MDDIMDHDIGQIKALPYEAVSNGNLSNCQAATSETDQHRPELARPETTQWTPEQWLLGLLIPVLEEPN
jgi:hypothetical protein